MWNLGGQTAIVTGAANGIGRATALLLARAGANTVAVDLERDGLESLERELEPGCGRILTVVTDVTKASAVDHAIEQALQTFHRIDILFANAAIQITETVDDTAEQDWDRLQAVNVKGIFLFVRAAVPVMRAQNSGAIVISASGHAFATYPGCSAYAATKGALVAFMRAVALDCAQNGIRANCIIPGATETRLVRGHFERASDPKAARDNMIATIPLGRLASPDDIANGVLFLCSEYASYITGSCLTVDGGLLARA